MATQESNLKRIKIDQLEVGMFIVNLGRSWFRHPFLRNQLKITSEKQIQKLKKYGIEEVYIDPDRGLDLPEPAPQPEEPAPPEPRESKAKEEIKEKESKLPSVPTPPPSVEHGPETPFDQLKKPESVAYWEKNIGRLEESLLSLQIPPAPQLEKSPFYKEILVAREIQQEAQNLVRTFMHDVRMGRNIESARVRRVVNAMVDSILRNPDALISLSRIKGYDEYTYVHSLDVCILCLTVGRHLNFAREELLELGMGALLHDVGMMKIPHHVLKKPVRLTEPEWAEIRKHPVYSLEILEGSPGISERSKRVAIQHHERCDGSGYPHGLKEEGIDIFAQVAGISDFYDAVTTDRYYQKGLQPHEGVRQIYERAGGEFNRLLVERFIQCIGIYPFGTLVLLDTEEIGIVCAVNAETLLRPKVLIIYRNSKTPYEEPFLADLNEKSEKSQWFKRTIIMPLDPDRWGIHVEAYLSDIKKNLHG